MPDPTVTRRSDEEIEADLIFEPDANDDAIRAYWVAQARLKTDVPALLAESSRLRAAVEAAERRSDDLRARISGWAISAHAVAGSGDWERRFLDALHLDDRALAAAEQDGAH